jgi:hypothetical protein
MDESSSQQAQKFFRKQKIGNGKSQKYFQTVARLTLPHFFLSRITIITENLVRLGTWHTRLLVVVKYA